MKYLINRKTKQHKVLIDDMVWSHDDWQLVGADSEGWIPHVGNECPLPDDARCEYIMRSHGKSITVKGSGILDWSQGNERYHITHYRPILEPEKVQEHVTDAARKERAAELSQIELAGKRMMLLDRLKAAHKAAQQIPDLEAELREMLGSMGYDLVARNPFVEAVDSDSLYELAHDTLQSALDDIWACSQSYSHDDLKNKIAFYCEQHSLAEPEATDKDMTDWRNWREGDVLECVNGDGHVSIASGNLVTVRQVQFTNGTIMFCHPDGFEGVALTRRFRFHSRPVKG